MTTVAVIDHGAGNLVSIAQGLYQGGADVIVTDRPKDLGAADGIVLPGVGTTGAAMARLRDTQMVEPLREWQGPLLGICVGLQLFFDHSEEDGSAALGLMSGRVTRLEDAPLLPHIGWNDIAFESDQIFAGIPAGEPFYFVHSFAVVPDDASTVIARTEYGRSFVAAARAGLRVGVQFHPERSGSSGLRMLANFVEQCARRPHAA